MGFGHGHGHTGGPPSGGDGALSASGRHRWRLAAAFGLTAAFFGVELVVGLISGSLALLSDAGHMAADVVALGAALIATRIAERSDPSGRRTYGSYRGEIFASGLAVLLMLGVSAYVVIEAIGRIDNPPGLTAAPMMVVGGIGLLINVICLWLLRAGAGDSLNVRGAYLEVFADAAGSVGVLVAGLLVSLTGDGWWDTAVALAIGVFVSVRAVILGRSVLHVLGQHAPADVDLDRVVADLSAIGGVLDVHDLHVWTLTSGMNVATAHLVAESARDPEADPESGPGPDHGVILREARNLLEHDHQISHATLQVESVRAARACEELDW